MSMFAQIIVETAWVLAVLGGAGTIIGILFKMLLISKASENALVIAQKDAALKELESVKKSYQEIAAEALKSATETTNWYRQKEGKPPLIPLAPVVPESHSPSTEKQREAALIQTMRATMAKIKLATGQDPRQEPEHAVEDKPSDMASALEKSELKDIIKEAVSAVVPAPEALKEAVKQAVSPIEATLKEIVKEAVKEEEVPEKTAERVVEKLKDQDN